MKKIVYLSGAFIGLSILFGLCYYVSFKNALLHYNREAVEQNTELLQQLLVYSGKNEQLLYEIINIEKSDEESLEVMQNPDKLCQDAEYVLETVFLSTNERKKEQMTLPSFMVGISREELTTYLNGYMECMPVNEYLDGLLSYEIVFFSENKVVLQKVYDETKVENQFYLCEKNGYVVIYYSDRRTVYEYTEIECLSMSAPERLRIQDGFYVKDKKELYSILEGYTS